MLFILRQLRRSFFQPGKLKTYVAYAIGEILLIVVGILIAVQIGDWKEARADEKRKHFYLERLVSNIERDIERLDFASDLSRFRIEMIDLMIKASTDLEAVKEQPVEFMFAVKDSYGTPTPPLSSDTYEEILSTGFIKLLDGDLYTALFEYYRDYERTKNNQKGYDYDQDRFRELRAGVLSAEQMGWMVNQYANVIHTERDEMRALKYDEVSVLEAAKRFQSKQDLIEWLPQLKNNSSLNLEALQQQFELAQALHKDLKQALEEL